MLPQKKTKTEILSPDMKICSRCCEVKHINNFSKHKEGRNGLRAACRICCKNSVKKYYQNNPHKQREKLRKYRKKYPNKKRESDKRYAKKYPKKRSAIAWRYFKNHPEQAIKKRIREKLHTEKLSDIYIVKSLSEIGFSKKQIKETPELIEIKRLIIKTKRLCRTSQS